MQNNKNKNHQPDKREDNEFEEKVILNPLVSLVAFTAPWCGHCKMLVRKTLVHGELRRLLLVIFSISF